MRYDLFTLRLLVAAAATGSIAAAAARHNTVASAASKRISDLEHAVGTPLLYRQRRGVEPTQAGRDLLRHAEGLLAAAERMEAEMSDYAEGLRGTVRLAANTSAITQFLPDDLAAFVRAHPGIRIDLVEMMSRDVLAAVRSGRADLGIFSGLTAPGGLAHRPYRRDRLVVVVPAGHPLAGAAGVRLADVLGEDFVALQRGSSIQAHLERSAEEAGATIRPRVEVMSFDGVRRMVEAGLGIAVLPEGAVAPYLAPARLGMVPLREPWAERELRVAARDEALLPRQARALLDAIASGPAGP